MLQRAMAVIAGAVAALSGGNRLYDGRSVVAIDGDDQNITVAAILAGIINRTGTTGNTDDVMPSVDSIVAAIPELNRGDSISFSIRMANAHTNTLTLGAGMTSAGTVGIVASNIREYLLTLTSGPSRTTVASGSTSDAVGQTKILTNIDPSVLATLSVGMAVSGTGVGASAVVTAINISAGTVLVSVDSTATGNNIALTFTPTATLFGVGTRAI